MRHLKDRARRMVWAMPFALCGGLAIVVTTLSYRTTLTNASKNNAMFYFHTDRSSGKLYSGVTAAEETEVQLEIVTLHQPSWVSFIKPFAISTTKTLYVNAAPAHHDKYLAFFGQYPNGLSSIIHGANGQSVSFDYTDVPSEIADMMSRQVTMESVANNRALVVWLCYLLGLAMIGYGYLCAFRLALYKPRFRLDCPSCGYGMTFDSSKSQMRCSECGAVSDS